MIRRYFTRRKMLRISEKNKTADQYCSVHTYGKVVFQCENTSKIFLNSGGLYLGCSWSRKPVFPGLMQLGNTASIHVNGVFRIYEGSTVYVNDGAKLVLGSGYANNRFNLSCFKEISIGQQVVISEGVTIRDSDNHQIQEGVSPVAPVNIGNNVWIGLNVTILKGVTIGNGAVIAAGAVVTSDIPANCLAGGVPAKVIRENINWK